MQLKFKKICLLSTIFVYCTTFLLQSNLLFFQTLAKEKNEPRVNIVAILVDSKIYDGISDDLKWYASNYVQQKLSDTKALVMPLDLTNIHAYDIYRMMENIYFDGLKNVNSSLIGLIMFGDIPLPVINQDGYIFPSVYPYIDFENQKYVWDPEIKYFVPNGNPEGQAEIWHGLINYGSDIKAYTNFFDKIKRYVKNPDDFIGDGIWYDDFIAQKESFLNENLPYYRNKIVFAEDLGYQRFSPLMRDLFRGVQTENAVNIVNELESLTSLEFSGKDLLRSMSNQGASELHSTKTIQQEIQTSFLSDYNDLFGNINMSTMRENIFAGGRRIKEYKDSNGNKNLIVNADSSASKLQIKDDVLLGNSSFKGLIENMNDLMEEMVDNKISDNKYDMDIVIPVSYENEGREKFRRFLRRRCISFPTRYDNYYFGLNARNVDSAKDLSIYRGTYRNLENLNGLTYNALKAGYNPIVGKYDSVNPKLKSIGASFDIFSNQAEGNRGYQMFTVENDLNVYDEEKKNSVVQYRREFKNKVNLKFWSDDCEKNDEDHICEDPFAFGLRWWGGASPFFVDSESISNGRYQLSGYKATDSWRSIFDMGGFQSLLPGSDEGDYGRGWVDGKGRGPQKAGATFRAYIKYSSPTERVGWEDSNGMKLSSMPFAKYVNNTPNIHGMSFSDMDYWRNGYVSRLDPYVQGEGEWQIYREPAGSDIFSLAVKPNYYDNTCDYYPSGPGRTIRWQKYTYKVISSIVKHVSTTEDEINGVDKNRYGEGGILEGYYINLKNSYNNVNKNVSDIVEELQSLKNSAENANVKREVDILSGKMVEILGLDYDISQLVEEIKSLTSELENASDYSEEWIRTKRATLSNLNEQLSGKVHSKMSVDTDISNSLTNLSLAIQNDKKTLVDVYLAIISLSADEILSSMEIIAKDEGLDPEKFYNKENNLNKVGFSQGWISEFVGIESNIKNGINSILNSYSSVFMSINEQKNKWNQMKSVFEALSEINSDKISVVSVEMDNIFNISSLLASEDNKTKGDDNEKLEDTILTGGTADSIIRQGQYVSCPNNAASEDNVSGNSDEDDSVGILGKFDGECGIINMRKWLIEVDKIGPQIFVAARGDVDFMVRLSKSSLNYRNFTQSDWINQYVQWTKGPGYDSEGAKRNHSLLLGASEHLSGINLLTPDRPIDSPRYVSMQSIAGNEISFIYPDLFKVEVYTSKGKNKSGYDIHELLSVGDIKNNLIKYLNGKKDEYNSIIEEECKKARVRNAFSDLHYLALRDILGYRGAVPTESEHGCNAKFTYGDFVKALGGDKMLDVISETLYYQSLTNVKKLSSENVNEDIKLIEQSFNLNDKREHVLKSYLTLGNEKVKNLIFEIPTYSVSGYEVAFINSDGKDYIFSEGSDSSAFSSINYFQNDSSSYGSNAGGNGQSTQQGGNNGGGKEDECNIPANGKLPLFKIGEGSPWFVGFKCWLQQTIKSPVKVKLTFGSSLGDILSSDSLKDFVANSELGQTFMDWGDSMESYGDSWDDLFTSNGGYDSDKLITQMQMRAESHNQEVIGGGDGLSNLLFAVNKNIRISNETLLLSDGNPSSELRIESISDLGNLTVEFSGTGDGCLKIDSDDLCGGKILKKTFNPKVNPFTGIVMTSDHVAGKVGLVIKVSVGGGYIEKVIKYTVSPSNLDHVDVRFGSEKSVAGILTPLEIVGYDKYNNKISWGLDNYDFIISKGKFVRDGSYQSGFSTNDFRNLKLYYQAPLDSVDGSVATFQILHNDSVVATKNQPIIQAYPVVKVNGNNVLQGSKNLETNVVYKLSDDESIYNGGKVNLNKLKKIEVAIMDSKGKKVDVDSQVYVSSQKGLVKLGQINKQENGEITFMETSKNYIKSGYAIIYFYPTTLAGDDRITVNIPGLDTRVINLSVKPADSKSIVLNLSDEYISLNEKNDLEISVSDVWGNPTSSTIQLRTDPRNIELRGVTEISRGDDSVVSSININGHTKVSVYGVGAGQTMISAGYYDKKGFNSLSDVEFTVDSDLLPLTGLNVMYLNYFGNDRGNQWGYLSNNNKRVEAMMKTSNKIITTTTLLASENKIKKVLWKIDPGLRITDFDGVNTTLTIKQGVLNMGIGGLSEMNLSLPSLSWITATFDSIDTLLSNEKSEGSNYIFFIPGDVEYSVKDGVLYDLNERIASIKDGEMTLQLADWSLDNGDNVWDVIYQGTNYGALVMHLPDLYPKFGDFSGYGGRYSIGNLFVGGSTDMMNGVGIFDGLSEFELYTNYKSVQDSNEVDARVGFLGDFKNITLFAEGEIVGEATRKYGSELLINLGDPVLSRKDVNEKVYGTNYDGGIGKEIYSDPDKDIFGVYQIDFNNDGLKDWIVVYQDGVFNLVKNYGGNPDLKEMQELMRVAVRIKNVFVGDADGNGYQDIFVQTNNNQIRVYLNNGGKFDVDGNLACLNQNVFEGEVSQTPSDLDGLNQFFVEDMDLDGVTDIVTYDGKGYIKIFYGGTTDNGPNYLSTEKYACDMKWYSREYKNITIVTALGVQVSEDDVFDNSMIRWIDMSKPEIKITSNDLPSYGVNFNPYTLSNLIDTDNVEKSIDLFTREVMSSDNFDVGVASSKFIQEESKFQEVTLYDNTLIGASGDSKNYLFAASSFLDPNDPKDKCSVRKNYRIKEGRSILMSNDIVTVRVTIKASNKASCIGSFGDIIQGPWNIYYDENGILKGIKFLKNKKNAVVKSRDGNFAYLIDNINLSPGEKMIFEYDLEYKQIPLKDMSITYKTFWSDDNYPDIKLQSIDGCEKNFDGYVNSGKRSFKNKLVPLQELINKEYADENDNTKDYAAEVSSYGGDISKLPGLLGDRMSRISLIQQFGKGGSNAIGAGNGSSNGNNSLKNAIFSEAGINLNIDLSIFDEQMDAIANAIDDIAQGMCNGFSFGGSNNCKGLPVPFNQAFLAPGKYHMFGCIEIPTGPLENGLPVFFFPGNLGPIPFIGYLPVPYLPKGPMDNFIWVPGGPIFSSFIRIYAAPTLTAQLGMAICMGPQNATISLPSPISDLGGNCVVFAIKPQCKGGGEGGEGGGRKNDDENPNEVYVEFVDDVKNSGVCLQSQKGSQVTEKGHRSSPFDLYSYSSHTDTEYDTEHSKLYNIVDSLGHTVLDPLNPGAPFSLDDTLSTISRNNMDVNGGNNNQIEFETSALGIINLETSAYIGAADSNDSNQNNSLFVGNIDISGGKFSVNKVRGGTQQGIRKILIDKWLDPQIRYIVNQLTKMHINIKLPDMSKLIDNEIQTMKNISETIGKEGGEDSNAGDSKKNEKKFEKTNTGVASKLGPLSYLNSNNLNAINDSIANPFESFATILNESNILNISVEPITVKIPMISAEDINAYEIYLHQWLDTNEKIIEKWKSLVDKERWKMDGNNIESVLNKNNIEISLGDWPKLQNQIYANLMTLQKYRNFPFEIYEWIHVIDRYISEIISLINNTIGYLSYWISTNSQRFVGYVDAIVLIINIIKTYQLLINFSVEWGQSCGSCSKDTYDQYSCKLSMLCDMIDLPIIQIPNFKLPNITIDLSNINLGLDIILPTFNFQPVRIELPQLPNLPEPPSIGVNIDLKLPNIPMLPEPPELPELPSFIPEIELELPVLPPAPELPKLPSVIETVINIAKMIGKIYCIVKGKFGLVGESSVKAKIEQLTQRTYEVKWIDRIMDFTNFSAAPVHNYGLDYEISAQVNMQFEFSTFYNYLDTLTKQINNLTTSSVNWVNNKANNLVNDNIVTGIGDRLDNSNFEFGVQGDLSMLDLSNINFAGLESNDIEYVDYNSAKARLQEVLTYFVQETKNTIMGDRVKSSISSIENQINKVNNITSNTDGLEKVRKDAINYLDEEKVNYDDLAELINHDYDKFLAMVNSDEINSKSILKSGQMLTYNINLFNLDSSTKDVVKNITKSDPYDVILNNKKTIIDGYWNAINSNSASDLGLSQSQYLVLRNNISSMKNQITTLYSVKKATSLTNLIAKNSLKSTDKTLLSSAGGGERVGSNMEVANVVDPSVLSEGIYGKIIEGGDKGKFTKIVYSDSFASNIGSQYYHTDHTNADDIILWDDGSVYLKCVRGNCNNGAGGYGGYYISKVIDEIPVEESWVMFDRETKLKISDGNLEIKNFEVDGQTYDDLQFSWDAEDVDAYLIKLVERVDHSYEKKDYTSVSTPVYYVLAIPEWVSVDALYSGNVKLELLKKVEKIEKINGKELVQIVTYNDNQNVVSVSISDIDRKWYYLRVAALSLNDDTYNVVSPWSNQIVAGKQIVGDDLPPEGNAVLYRPSVDQVVSEGDYLDGFVGTRYKLSVNREDNVALSYIALLKDGEVLDEKYTSNTGDSLSVNIGIHTKSGSEKFSTIGIDQYGNKTEKTIIIDYDVPDIDIVDISKNSDGKTVAIKANLSQDIDQGNVSFQRRRGEQWKPLARKSIEQADFSLGPKQDIVVGSPYSYDNEVAMYDKNGDVIALMNPFTAEINLQSGYKEDFEVRAVVQDGIIFKIFNKNTNQSVFSINVPAQSCLKFEADGYDISSLDEVGKMGMFNGGKTIYKDGLNVLYVSKSCHLYSDFSLEGSYDYDRELDAVMLSLYLPSDLSKSSPVKVWFKVKPMMEN